MITRHELLRRLEQTTGHAPRRVAGGWLTCCPAHDDRRPSLSVGERDDGSVSVHCFAGCRREAVLRVLSLSPRDLHPARGRPALRRSMVAPQRMEARS